ncbi:MAG: DUF362 domain-containing protein [Lentisphaeria bacterium]|nr:DUF362 domain-containing protein [Lentisphaeria bacterium]
MSRSKVYFADMRTKFGESLPQKLARLIRSAGIETLPLQDSFTAVKIHFGEPGNLAFLRHAYARSVVDVISAKGARPFLTDCNTLYPGRRKNALEHLDTAYCNGFTPYATGCQVIIADGLKGTDEVDAPVPNGILLKTAKIGRAVMDADIVITLNHFKAHELTGIGGAIKNAGMGCGSRAGKKDMHCDGITQVNKDRCIGCGKCLKACAHSAPQITDGKAVIHADRCVGCGRCIGVCPKDAISPVWSQAAGLVDKKMTEYAAAVLAGRPQFHISLAVDISPYCDCHAENDVPIVPNIGMFASFDPVAIDRACADMVNQAQVMPGSALSERLKEVCDHFTSLFPETDWRIQLDHAEAIGLGSQEYELITI